jgi:hypothetical protein
MIVEDLIAYWTGRGVLSDAARAYLRALFRANSYGMGSFEEWLSLLYQLWQGSLPSAGGYEIPLRKSGMVISPPTQQAWIGRTPSPPSTKVRFLRGA